ncbi:unnamed protein product, partial [Closterium sp. NIES-53]
GGEFSSDLLRAFSRAEGIRQTFTLPASPQQNGIAEHRIGMVMDVARTSMIHATSPHFLWPFAVQYATHHINLQPRVSLPETTRTLRWIGKFGDASVFRVWGSRAFVRDTSADKLSSRAVPCVFLGFPPNATGWQFYHPTSRRVLSSQDVMFDESVSYFHLVEVAVDSGAARGAEPARAEPEGVESGGAEPESVEPGGIELGGAVSGGAVPGGAEPERANRAAGATGPTTEGASGAGAAVGAAGAGAAGAAGPRGAGAGGTGAVGGPAGVGAAGGTSAVGGPAGVGAAGGAVAAGPRGAHTGGTGAAGAGGAGAVATRGAARAGAVGGTGAGGAAGVVAGDPGAEGTGSVSAVSGGAARPRLYYVPLLQQVLGLPPSTGPTPPLPSPLPVQSQSQLQPGPSPYSGLTRGLTERREPESCPASPESRRESPVCTVCTSRRFRPPHSLPTEAPLQTLHMDMWGPARVRGQGYERYFLLVVDDYSRYTTVFPLRSKGEVPEVLIDWIRGARRQLSERFGSDLPVLRLHSGRGFQYAAHQINLQPRVSLPETTPTLRWTGKVGDASAFRFYHPTSRRVLSSQDVTFDESVSYYRTPPVDPAEPVEVAVDSAAPRGAEPAGAGIGGAEPGGAEPMRVESGGAEPTGAEPWGSEPERVESGGAEPARVEPGGAEPGGTASWGAEPAFAESGVLLVLELLEVLLVLELLEVLLVLELLEVLLVLELLEVLLVLELLEVLLVLELLEVLLVLELLEVLLVLVLLEPLVLDVTGSNSTR